MILEQAIQTDTLLSINQTGFTLVRRQTVHGDIKVCLPYLQKAPPCLAAQSFLSCAKEVKRSFPQQSALQWNLQHSPQRPSASCWTFCFKKKKNPEQVDFMVAISPMEMLF